MNYKLIEHTDKGQMIFAVNRAIEDGFIPQGGYFYDHEGEMFVQAVVHGSVVFAGMDKRAESLDATIGKIGKLAKDLKEMELFYGYGGDIKQAQENEARAIRAKLMQAELGKVETYDLYNRETSQVVKTENKTTLEMLEANQEFMVKGYPIRWVPQGTKEPQDVQQMGTKTGRWSSTTPEKNPMVGEAHEFIPTKEEIEDLSVKYSYMLVHMGHGEIVVPERKFTKGEVILENLKLKSEHFTRGPITYQPGNLEWILDERVEAPKPIVPTVFAESVHSDMEAPPTETPAQPMAAKNKSREMVFQITIGIEPDCDLYKEPNAAIRDWLCSHFDGTDLDINIKLISDND
jgi:hypothetical protein